jgi:hypothetical protein
MSKWIVVMNNSLISNDFAKLIPSINKIVPYDPPTIIVDPTVYSTSLEAKLVGKGYKIIFVKEKVADYMSSHKNTLLLTTDLTSTLNLTRSKWFLVNHPESLVDNIQILDNYILTLRKRSLNV